jgi:hypothetical protein
VNRCRNRSGGGIDRMSGMDGYSFDFHFD